MIAQEERIARYRQIEQSAEMKEYLELKKVVESKEFQQKKYNWVHTKYKSTSTYETISQYKKMLHNKEPATVSGTGEQSAPEGLYGVPSES